MDTFRDYLKLNELWENAPAPWEVWHHAQSVMPARQALTVALGSA
jgi:hypothetical protein